MGDKTVVWEPTDEADAQRAQAEYDALAAAGFNILDPTGKGKPKVCSEFPAKAGAFLATKDEVAEPKAAAPKEKTTK